MFDFLKKKIGGFVDKLTKKEEAKEEPGLKETDPRVKDKAVREIEAVSGKIEPDKSPAKAKSVPESEETPEKIAEAKQADAVPKAKPELPEKPEIKKIPEPALPKKQAGAPPITPEKPEQEKKPRERIKVGAIGAIKSFITKEVEITENDLDDLLEEFELELLEADVDISVAEAIKRELKEKLVGAKVKKDALHNHINGMMKETLVGMMINDKSFELLEKIRQSEKPFRIMFLGINGSGKTTTIAKVAKLLMDNNYKVVFAAADTFRAAAIEQIGVHADRLGVKLIKRDYGSDPTSVAYDAGNYAKAHGIDVVLIDTAGRQDTNISLINEMKKMNRVIEPHLKIYIGESVAGNAIIQQISSFGREIGIDAVILTKLDCDPKGGTMLSINRVTGVPIIYVGTGQEYHDLEEFDARAIVERIVE